MSPERMADATEECLQLPMEIGDQEFGVGSTSLLPQGHARKVEVGARAFGTFRHHTADLPAIVGNRRRP